MLDTRNFTKKTPPSIPYETIKNAVLGEAYDLSLVFTGSTRSRSLNLKHRGKDKPANVLSFPYSPEDGELFLDLNFAKDENSALLLFIHGLYHLKGMDHGRIMDENEAETLKKFSKQHNGAEYNSGNRRRNIRSSGGRH